MKISHILPILGMALFCQCHESYAEGTPAESQKPTEVPDKATDNNASKKALPKLYPRNIPVIDWFGTMSLTLMDAHRTSGPTNRAL